MPVKSIAECPNGSILQYIWPSLSYHCHKDLCFVSFWVVIYTGFTVVPKSHVLACLFTEKKLTEIVNPYFRLYAVLSF